MTSRNKPVRVNIYLYAENAALLSLACVDPSFGGMRYGEQTRIINEALKQYFTRKVVPCIPQKQSQE